MPTEKRKALDDDDNEVEISKESDSQVVTTVDKPIEYRIRPHWFGPDNEPLTADGEGAFRSPLGKRYRLIG